MECRIEAINISKKKGVVKEEIPEVHVDALGFVGDAHAGEWHRQISLLSQESVHRFAERSGYGAKSGEFAENLLLTGVDFTKVKTLDRFRFGDVEIVVTQIGKKCHGAGCAIYNAVGECVMPKEGVFAKVLQGGHLTKGQTGEYLKKTLRFRVLTLSDRASRGVYEDRSGPLLVRLIEEAFGDHRSIEVERLVIPDDPEKLRKHLTTWKEEGVDVIFTTGGTGVGPRDFTPEVVREVFPKELPGIMEHVRTKYGASIPNALLSRSVAAVGNQTQVYAVPGSVKAVKEYFEEIQKSLIHLVEMLHGLGH